MKKIYGKSVMNRKSVKTKQSVAHLDDYKNNELERSIGNQVRVFRKQLKLTVSEAAEAANLSPGMLSKIENGNISPSLATINSLSLALNVPVTAFFRKYEQKRDCAYVKANEGLIIERQGTRAGHQYQLLGHTMGKKLSVEPYLITINEKTDVFPLFQHDGVEFIYMIKGKAVYRYADQTFTLSPGDSLCFDSDGPHGPEELIKLPVVLLSVIVSSRLDD